MALTPGQLEQVWLQLVANDATVPRAFQKPDLRAAAAAADAWATTAAASFNAALPDPFKSNASAAQKAALLAYVCLKRAGQ